MKTQVTELLTQYDPVRALWFDGYWDHNSDSPAFDWRMPELYAHIHSLRPACLIGNNHHIAPIEGEDFQMFERDLPGENTAGFSAGQEVSRLPLEMCQTMNGMWGYKVADMDYKSVADLVQLLVRAAGKGSNLLLNIGPRADGSLPDLALDRLKGMGEWMKRCGATIYGTQAGEMAPQPWGTSTRRADTLFVHVLSPDSVKENTLWVPLNAKVRRVISYTTRQPLPYVWKKGLGVTIQLPEQREEPDFVIEIHTR